MDCTIPISQFSAQCGRTLAALMEAMYLRYAIRREVHAGPHYRLRS